MAEDLLSQRLQAAQITRGISTDHIHRLTLNLCRQVNLGDRLLEFGAGSGGFINEITATGYRGAITGIDIMSRPSGLTSEKVDWVTADLNEPIPLPDGSFSSIVSMEVIEHLENPRFVFREFFRLLRPGGTLIVTTPNQESLRSYLGLVFGGHFVAFLGESYPAHITALLREDFERICQETGFAKAEFSFTGVGGIPKMPNLRWQQVTLGLCRGRLFSDNIALLTRKP